MVTRWDVTSLGYIWLFNDIIILVRCSKLIPTCLVTRGLTSAPTKKQIYKSILIHSPSYPAIGAIRRRAAWSFSTASAFAINKAKAHDYLAWSYIIYTSTARYCWTHPHTVATEQAARLLATVSSWKTTQSLATATQFFDKQRERAWSGLHSGMIWKWSSPHLWSAGRAMNETSHERHNPELCNSAPCLVQLDRKCQSVSYTVGPLGPGQN